MIVREVDRVKALNKKRIMFMFFVILFLLSLLIFRVAWIQIVKADEYSEKAINQQKGDIPIEAKRGFIFDRNGKELAASATSYNIWVRPPEIAQAYKGEKLKDVAQKLAPVLGKSEEDISKSLQSELPIVRIATYLDKETMDKVKALKIQGIDIAQATKRHYPLGDFASKLLGSVNDDNIGRSGIEMEYDQYLSGVAGRWIRSSDINGDPLSYGSDKYYGAEDGLNVVLTLDEVIQHYLEKAVAAGIERTKAKRIMAIAMDPKTGDILAMVTNPTFNPNDPTEPINEEEKKEFEKMNGDQQTAYLSDMWRNPIVSDTYEPGSTFKLLTTSAALEEGIVTPDSVLYCNGYEVVSGVEINCWYKSGHGAQTIKEAIGNSCNPVQMQLAAKLGKEKYYDYLDMFGITRKTGIDYPGETGAIIQPKDAVGPVELATISFGQGIAVTPIQLITSISSIGNNGILMEPRLVKELTDKNGKTVKKFPIKPVRKVISPNTSAEMRDIMEYEVSEGGGGTAKVPGLRVGGKTGTADKVVDGEYTKDTYSSFIGMAPMNDPQIAILVVVDSPGGVQYGSVTAGPVAKEFLQNTMTYLDIKPQFSEGEEDSSKSKYILVPNVTGKTYEEAIGILAGAGLKYQLSPQMEVNSSTTILDQFPKPGKKIKSKEQVYIYVE